jgi:isopenicillin N synthase-like dioxygenase
MRDGAVPVIDVAPLRASARAGKDEVARQIDRACTEMGFFCITGHGVDHRLIARTREAATRFFALPDDRKLAIKRRPDKVSRGYYPFADRSLAYTLGDAAPPDLQEAWAMGPIDVSEEEIQKNDVTRRFYAGNLWPEDVPDFRETLCEYYRTLSPLADDILTGFALALGRPGTFFDDKCDRASSVIRLIRYPAQNTAPATGQLRAGAHTDYGTVTILRGDDVPGATQVLLPSNEWIDVRPPPGGFVCNIGDAMADWTGGRWRSTLHRVANPPPDAAASDRISIVFFHQPNHDAVLGGLSGVEDGGKTYSEHYLGKVVKASRQRLGDGAEDASPPPPSD